MATPITPGKYYDILKKEEVLLTYDDKGALYLVYAESGVWKNAPKDYIQQNLIDTNSLADTLFDDTEIE